MAEVELLVELLLLLGNLYVCLQVMLNNNSTQKQKGIALAMITLIPAYMAISSFSWTPAL
jgi:hypothetical protein